MLLKIDSKLSKEKLKPLSILLIVLNEIPVLSDNSCCVITNEIRRCLIRVPTSFRIVGLGWLSSIFTDITSGWIDKIILIELNDTIVLIAIYCVLNTLLVLNKHYNAIYLIVVFELYQWIWSSKLFADESQYKSGYQWRYPLCHTDLSNYLPFGFAGAGFAGTGAGFGAGFTSFAMNRNLPSNHILARWK